MTDNDLTTGFSTTKDNAEFLLVFDGEKPAHNIKLLKFYISDDIGLNLAKEINL